MGRPSHYTKTCTAVNTTGRNQLVNATGQTVIPRTSLSPSSYMHPWHYCDTNHQVTRKSKMWAYDCFADLSCQDLEVKHPYSAINQAEETTWGVESSTKRFPWYFNTLLLNELLSGWKDGISYQDYSSGNPLNKSWWLVTSGTPSEVPLICWLKLTLLFHRFTDVMIPIDYAASRILSPFQIPVGLMTGALGGAYMLWLLHRSK